MPVFGSAFQLAPWSITPSVPDAGQYLLYVGVANTLNLEDSFGNVYTFGATTAITQLTGDVLAIGPGSAIATVAYVGGYTAAQVAASVLLTLNATNLNVPNTLVERDLLGNFSATLITANLSGNATTATSAVSATTAVSFTGPLLGDVTGTQGATSVVKIQGINVNSTLPLDGQIFIYNSTTLQWVAKTLSGDIANIDSGVVTIQPNVVTNSKLAPMAMRTTKANVTGATANPTDVTLGTLTEVTSSVLTLIGWSFATLGSPTIQVLQAGATQSGYLSAADWNTFNNTTGAAITALTGDGTAHGPGSVPFTLATVNSNIGSFGNQSTVATFTVNGKGLITAAANVTIGGLTNSNLSGTAGITGANIATSTVTNNNLSQMPANTVKANTTGIPANPVDTALGTLTEATSSVLVLVGWADATIGAPTIQVLQATTSESGYLSSTDWNTFNNKQGAGNYITALTGDGTASGPGSVGFTLATVNSNVGTFGSSTSIPTVTVNGKGLITAISGNAVVAPAGTLTGTTLATNVVSSSLTSVGTLTTGIWNAGAITAPSITDSSLTAGSVVFVGASGLLTQDNANFNWNDTAIALGIGLSAQTASVITTINTSGAAKPIWMFGYGAGSTPGIRGDAAGGTLLLPTATPAADKLFVMSGRGYGTSFASASTGSVEIIAGALFTAVSMPTLLAFKTTPSGSVLNVQSMTLNYTGNLLLGTTTDNGVDNLQVQGGETVIGNSKIAYATTSSATIGAPLSTSIHQINGGLYRTTKTITASYTVDTTTTDDVILCNQTAGITITLPIPTVGRTIVIKDISGNAETNNITIAPHSTENIEGLASTKVFQTNFGSLTLHVGAAGNWWVIG